MADTPNNFNNANQGNNVSGISSDDLKSEMQKELDKLSGKVVSASDAPHSLQNITPQNKVKDVDITGSDFHPDTLKAEMQQELQKLTGAADLGAPEPVTPAPKPEPIKTPAPGPAPAPKPIQVPIQSVKPKPVVETPTKDEQKVAQPKSDSVTITDKTLPKEKMVSPIVPKPKMVPREPAPAPKPKPIQTNMSGPAGAPPANLPVGDGPIFKKPIPKPKSAPVTQTPPKLAIPTPPPAPKAPAPAATTKLTVPPAPPKPMSPAPKPVTPVSIAPKPKPVPVTQTPPKPVVPTPPPTPKAPISAVPKPPAPPKMPDANIPSRNFTPPSPQPRANLNIPPVPKPKEVTLPPVPKPPTPAPTKQEAPLLSRVHTLKSDMSTAVKHDNYSLARSALKSEERKTEKIQKEKRAHRTSTVFALLSVLFILAGGTIIGYYFFFINQTEENPFQAKMIFPEPLIFSDIDESLELTDLLPSEAEETLVRVAKTPTRTGELQNFNFFERMFGINGEELSTNIIFGRDLLSRLGVRHPERLSRFMTGAMFGTYMTDVQHGFFIIEHDSYQRVFAEMLLWEEEVAENNMVGELYNILAVGRSVPEDIFEEAELNFLDNKLDEAFEDFTFETSSVDELTGTSTDPTATSTDFLGEPLEEIFEELDKKLDPDLPEPSDDSPWKNEVIQNIDVRTLRNDRGELVLLYSFLGTRDILIITADLDTFTEIRTRYQTPNVTR